VPMAQALGLREAPHGRIRCRKTLCMTIRDRHSVSRSVLQRSSLLGERPEPAEFATERCSIRLCLLAPHQPDLHVDHALRA
jgi:hypothetical protein